MSTFHTPNGSRGQHCSPRHESRPYRPSPGRREHIYGRIHPMQYDTGKIDIRLLVSGAMFALLFIVIFVVVQ